MLTNNAEKVFRKRPGTTHKGDKYEDIITSKLALELATNDDVENFDLSSNDNDFGNFDDVVLEVINKHQISTKYAIQLKHLNAEKNITRNMLSAEKGDFSIEKYFQSFKEIKKKHSDRTEIKFLLYTNGKFDFEGIFKLNKNVRVKVKKINISTGDKLIPIINTSENNSVFQFHIEETDPTIIENDDEIDEYKQFFKQFFLYSNQKNVDELKITLLKHFQKTYYSDEISFNMYTDFITKWSEAEGDKIQLRKKIIRFKIAEILLKPFILPASEKSLDFSKYRSFIETCFQYDIISFETNEEDIMKQMKKLFTEQKNQIDKTIVELFFPETRNLSKIPEETKKFILWHMNALPLVLHVKEDNQAIVNLAINLCLENHGLERKFVLVGENIMQENLKQIKSFQTLNDLSIDSDFLQEFIHNNKVTIQGRHILLEKLITNNKDIKEIITPVEVMKIINGNLTIGEEKEQLPDPYIDQFLSSPFTELRYLNEKNENVVPVISCSHRMDKNLKTKFFRKFVTAEEYMKNDKDDVNASLQNVIIGIEDECSKEQFQEICKKNPNKMYHHFLFKSNGRLKWMESNRSIETLRKKIKFEYLQESEIFDTTDSRINIIASKPGMGKSILLKYLKNHALSNYWIVDINLREHFHFFKEIPLNAVEYFLSFQAETQKYDGLTLKIRNAFEKRKKLLFLWDGFDELPTTYWKKALEIIESLIDLDYSNWLTTRDYLQRMLEDKFNVFAITIKEIDEEQQRFYIKKRLKTNSIEVNDREVTQIANKIIENIKTTGDVSFLGIPLHLSILTELFIQDPERYIQLLNSTFTLPDLIGYSIEEKFNFFYKNKCELDPTHPHLKNVFEYYKQCKEAEYELIALKSYLPDEMIRNLHFCYAELSKKIKVKSEDIGLIIKTDDDSGTAIFVHNVYGEYFVARWMANNKDLMPQFKNVFFTDTFNNIRMIFDMMMAKGCSAHLAVLYKNVKLLRKNKTECSSKDKAGRSPLHLACSWGEQRPILPVEKEEEDKYVIDDSNDNIVTQEDKYEYKEILDFLLQLTYDPLKKDDMFLLNCLEYADVSLSMLALEMLRSKGKLPEFESLQNFRCIYNILYYSIKFDYQELFKMIKNIPYIETKVNKENLLHLATTYDRTDYLDRIFDNKKYVERINEKNCKKKSRRLDMKNENGNISFVINDSVEMLTALHLAAVNGNCEVIKKLVDKGANIDVEDNNGYTVLHLAIIHKHLKVIRLLINKYNAKINHNNNLGDNELHLAVMNVVIPEDLHLLKYVMKLGIEMKKNKLNMYPLDYAVMSQNFDIITLFFETKYYLKKQLNSIIFHSPIFTSALFSAIYNNQFDMVHNLIEYNTNVNVSDGNGNTPLHLASINSNIKILKLLLQKGADINQTNKQGKSALMINFRSNPKLDVIEFLLQKGSDANLSDVNGQTLMHYCVMSENIKICEFTIIKNREKYKIDIDAQNVDGNTPLIVALAKENLEIANLLIRSGVNLSVKNNNGISGLHVIAERGNSEILKLLLSSGVSVNDEDINGETPLHRAAYSGRFLNSSFKTWDKAVQEKFVLTSETSEKYYNLVKLLIENNSNVNQCDKFGHTPLHNAALSGNLKVVELLIQKGCDSNKTDVNGFSALSYAIWSDNKSIYEFLLNNKEKYRTDINHEDKNGNNINLLRAIQTENIDALKFLLANGVNINSKNKSEQNMLYYNYSSLEFLQVLIELGCDVNAIDKAKKTPLHNFVNLENLKICEFIIKNREKYSIDIDAQDMDGNTPLLVAIDKENLEITNLLIRNGASLNTKNKNNATGLHFVAQRGNLEISKLLLSSQANVSDEDINGETPLHTAAYSGRFLNSSFNSWDKAVQEKFVLTSETSEKYYNLVKLLIENNSNVNQCDKFGHTPLHNAALSGNLRVVELLIQKGCDSNKTDVNGFSALSYAIWSDNKSIYEFLLNNKEKYGIDINQENKNGNNINLLRAIERENVEAIKLLLANGVNINKRNTLGQNILYNNYSSLEFLQILIELGCDLNVIDKAKRTPLHYFVYFENIKICEFIIKNREKYSIDIDAQDVDGNTLLLVATDKENLAIANLLIKSGANLNVKNKNGNGALHIIAKKGNAEILKLLLNSGVSVDDENIIGETPLHSAAYSGIFLNSSFQNWNKAIQEKFVLTSENLEKYYNFVKLLIENNAIVNQCDRFGKTPLHNAAFSGNLRVVELLIQKGCDLNKTDVNGLSALPVAIWSDNKSVYEFLLNNKEKYGIEINQEDKNGNNINLLLAIETKNIEALKLLLANGVNINSKNKSEQNMLYYNYSSLEFLPVLIELGCDVNVIDKAKRTPLHNFVNLENLKICEFIIKNREKYSIDIDAQDMNGDTPLMYALVKENLEIANLLIRNGANLNVKNKNGISGMHIVAETGNLEIFKLLLSSGVSVNDEGSNGETPLHRAAFSGRFLNSSFKTWDEAVQEKFVLTSETSEKYYNMVKLLIENNSNVNQCDKFGKTPLHYAAFSGNLKLVELLIQKGCDLNKTNVNGFSALFYAIWSDNKSVYEFLLNNKEKYSLNVYHEDRDGNNISLYSAVQRNNIDAVKLLSVRGVNLNSRNQEGATVLHLASAWDKTEIVQHLLELGAEINVKDNNGQTPLHYAAYFGKLEIVKILIRNGSPIDAENNFGQTPLIVALMSDQREVASFFLSLPR